MGEEPHERFDALYRLARSKILTYALRRSSSLEDAADIAAETFAIAWRRLDQVPSGEEAVLWLYAVARNLLRKEHQRGQRRCELIERVACNLPDDALRCPPGDEDGLVALLCLRALPEDDREVLMLGAWEGLRPAAIARVLGCSPGAARVRMHRARRRLQQVIAEHAAANDVAASAQRVEGRRIDTSETQGGVRP